MTVSDLVIKSDCGNKELEWEFYDNDTVYECKVAVVQGEDCFESFVVDLPGALSYGPTVDEAVKNAKESATGVIKAYKADGVPIPWDLSGSWYDTEEKTILVKRVLVHA